MSGRSQHKSIHRMRLSINCQCSAAFGAVFVAGVGVYAVFKMAFMVAGSTGRSLNAEDRAATSSRPSAA